MFQTYSSLNQSQTSPQSPGRFKFKSKISFFNDHLVHQTQTRITPQYRDQMRTMIEYFQQNAQFIHFPEFNSLKQSQVAVSIQYNFNPRFKSTGDEDTKESFQDLIDEIKQTIMRKYPFVKIIKQVYQDSQVNSDHWLQIQLYSLTESDPLTVVLYARHLSKTPVNAKLVGDAIWLYLKKFNLTVSVDCPHKNAVPVCEENSQVSIMEGLKVTIRQRDHQSCLLQSAQTPTKQIVIRTSFCQPSSGQKSGSKIDIFKSVENIRDMEKSVRVYFSPTKTQNWSSQTVVSSIDLQQPTRQEKKFTVKLFAQSQLTSCFEEAKFNDLVQQVSSYEIEITGAAIQTAKTILNVDEILVNSENLFVSTRVERVDLLRCLVKVQEDSIVNVTKHQTTEQLLYDQEQHAFVFWGRVQQEYLIEISRKDCFPQKRLVFLQGVGDYTIEFDMVSCVETTLQFRAYNIIWKQAQKKEIEKVKLELLQSDQVDQEPLYGNTDDNGMFSCPGLMFKQVRVHAKRKGFLQVSYDFDVRANSTGQIYQLPMIPDFYSLINQYHILIYVPNKHNFQLDYSLVCPDGVRIDNKTRSHPVMRTKLEVNRITPTSSLLNFSIHVQSLDPFLRDNCFQFFISNQKPKRTMLCQEAYSPQHKENTNMVSSTRSPKQVNINEMFLKTRVMQTEVKSFIRQESETIAQKINTYCAEDSVRIFVTFGHKIIDTMMVQSNLLLQNEKCFGVVDLDKRQFIKENNETQFQYVKRNLSKMPTFKKESQFDDKKLSTILSHITNQKFQE